MCSSDLSGLVFCFTIVFLIGFLTDFDFSPFRVLSSKILAIFFVDLLIEGFLRFCLRSSA